MHRHAVTLLFGLILLGTGCRRSGTEADIATITLADTAPIAPQEIIDTYRYVPLGATCIPIGSISRLIVTDDLIVAVDRDMAHAIFVFDRDGVPQAEICAVGRGPNEYAELTHVAITQADGRDALAILDALSGKVLLYSMSGDFIGSHAVPFRIEGMEYLPDGDVLCYAADYAAEDTFFDGRNDAGNLIYFTDGDFGIKEAAMPDRTPNRNISYTVPHVRRHGERITVVPPLGDTVYTVEGHTLRPEYRVDISALAGTSAPAADMTDSEIIDAVERFPMLMPDGTVEGDDFIIFSVTSPQDKGVRRFIYDKRTAVSYMIENGGGSASDEARLAKMAVMGIKAACGNEYISDIPAFVVPMIYPDGAEDPALTRCNDASNPILVFYTFKSI